MTYLRHFYFSLSRTLSLEGGIQKVRKYVTLSPSAVLAPAWSGRGKGLSIWPRLALVGASAWAVPGFNFVT